MDAENVDKVTCIYMNLWALCDARSDIVGEIDNAALLEEDRLMVVCGEGCQILGKQRRDDDNKALLEPLNQLSRMLL
jgi:hypothetical protein